ncbi:MAG: hypothetical protein IPH72_12135 [Sandaracinaceae bacterium]|nr:hypothetical protein [Sandaracinaceae bacterium]
MKSPQPSILIAGPVNVRASLEQALTQHDVRVHGCSFPDLIATCAGTSPSLVVLAGTMKGVELGMAATALAEHVATRAIPVAILTAEPGVPPARRADAAPLTLVLSHQGITSVVERLVELARSGQRPQGRPGAIAEEAGASKSGGEPQVDDRLDPFLSGEPTEDTGSGPIRALHLQASIASEPSTNVTRSRDWTWEDSPQGTALTDDNDDQKAAKQRRLARTMMGVAPAAPGGASGQGPAQGPGVDGGEGDGDMPAPAASRAGAWGAKSDSVMPTGFPPSRPKPLARAALRKAEPSTVGPLPTDEEQAPVISPIVGPPRTAAKARPKTMLGVGLPLPGATPAARPPEAPAAALAPEAAAPAVPAPATATPAAAPSAPATPAAAAPDAKKARPRTMLGLGLSAPQAAAPPPASAPAAPAPAAPAAPAPSAAAPVKSASSISSTSLPAAPAKSASSISSTSLPAVQGTPPARTPKFTPAAPMAAVSGKSPAAAPAARPTPAAATAKPALPAAPAQPAAKPAAPAPAPAAPASATPAAASAAPAPRSAAPGPRRSANRTIMGGMSSPLSPPPPVNLPSHRPDDTAVVVTESERPAASITASGGFAAATPTGPAAAQFGGAASMDFTDEPTVVGDSVKRAAAKDLDTPDDLLEDETAKSSATQMAGAGDDFDDFDDLGLGMDHDEATQILDQSSIAAAKLEALRAKSAQPDDTEFDTLRPPATPAAPPSPPGQRAAPKPSHHDDFEVAATEPPPPGIGIDGIVPEGTLSLTDALELDFDEPDRLGRTLEMGDEPITGGAANPEPLPPVRPKAYQPSQSGTEEDTEIVAGLTKQLEQKAVKQASSGSSSRGWLWATMAIVLVGGVAATAWYVAPTLLGTAAHSDDTVAHTPVPTPPGADPVPTPPVTPPPTPTTDVAAPTTDTPPTPPVEPPPEVVAVAEVPPTPPVEPPPVAEVPPTPPVTPPVAAPATGDEARLRQALAANDEDYEAMAALAEVLLARGGNDEALTLAQAAVRGRARVGRYHMIYGDARAATGDRSGASRSWSRAVEVDPALAAEVNRRRSAN